MDTTSITAVEMIGIHGQYDVRAKLKPGLNILFGMNGSGKTTFLHVLANLVEGDLERFCNISFKKISVTTDRGLKIDLIQTSSEKETAVEIFLDGQAIARVGKSGQVSAEVRQTLRQHLGGRPVYLPAFRSVLEAIRSAGRYPYEEQERGSEEYKAIIEREMEGVVGEQSSPWSMHLFRERVNSVAYKTLLCRGWFGSFVPIVRCPSLWEVSDELAQEFQQAQLQVASTDRTAFSTVFFHVLEAALATPSSVDKKEVQLFLTNIRNNLAHLEHSEVSGLYKQIEALVSAKSSPYGDVSNVAKILRVYDTALSDRKDAVDSAFYRLRTFEESVNRFLQGKKLSVEEASMPTPSRGGRLARPAVITLANGLRASISVLSSGERQVLTLLFSATHMSAVDGIVLIDEPELSLHVGWQNIMLKELTKQAGDRQVVACTHAPEIGADHRDRMVELTAQMSLGSLPIRPGE